MDADRPSTAGASLACLLGTPDTPAIFDVRKHEDFAASEFFIPGALRWDYLSGATPPPGYEQRKSALAYCVKGQQVGADGAEKLAAVGLKSSYLEGGLRAWQAAGYPVIRKRPDLGVTGESVSQWVTRARPKIDRIACPWLVRRFIDPQAIFHYVPTAEVFGFAKANHALAYDIPGAPLEHDGPLCSFDSFLRAFGLDSPALATLATIIRGADTDSLELAPQSAGLLAISLGMSKAIADDAVMLDAMMPVYDALYRWALESTDEQHNWKP